MKNLCYPLGILALFLFLSCESSSNDFIISKKEYQNKLHGFWLGQSIANWTGLVTEMDKIGNIGDIKTGNFYTRENWQQPDHPSIWGEGVPSELSKNIDFVLRGKNEVWGADDDTDIEYMYQFLLNKSETSILSPEQIRNGWLRHIKAEEENYLWVSNQKALDLMNEGKLPPETSDPRFNEHYEMIDAQLTTEIFGLFAPNNPKRALEIAHLPIRTTARNEAAEIAEFYVIMHSLAIGIDKNKTIDNQTFELAEQARVYLSDDKYPAKMYDFVKQQYLSGVTWEEARDAIYQRYQVEQKDGYNITDQKLYCNGCFAAGINFAAGMISWFYGKGNFKETIKIGVLLGWDSDNPTATWGGLLGFIHGKEAIENNFDIKLSNKFNIHRTRQNFPNNGLDTFENMAKVGVNVTEKVLTELTKTKVDTKKQSWILEKNKPN